MPIEEKSPKFKLNREDLQKVGRGAVVAVVGALAVYIIQTVPNIDFGAYTPIMVALAGVLANTLRKWVKDNSI